MVSDLRVRLGEPLGGGDYALAALSGEADYEIGLLQWTAPYGTTHRADGERRRRAGTN